ncbi:MAG: tRNA preQ1(34) S-adenosylmethionine ribosyltransferase-isomerase QueA [Proteobacteria bacterium]|nr:tRNA preQ1(34) S-adenosylmethionine ribosyltransferase-isomerase QueA [Pseudomonadota bacterium]
MRTDLFDFELPLQRIALRPAAPRDAARLMVVRPGGEPLVAHCHMADFPGLLRTGDVLVVNDTKVIAAALNGRRIGRGEEARVAVNLIRRRDASRWEALARPAKKLRVGDVIRFGREGRVCLLEELDASVEARGQRGAITLNFSYHGAVLDQAIADHGNMPLPPYITTRRGADVRDRGDYQTVFARAEGAVAAPTAGLHFTHSLLAALDARGIGLQRLTLHVGAGTFLPVTACDTDTHEMHSEWGAIEEEGAAALNAARARGGRIVAIGTTSLRLLESAADATGRIHPFRGETSIFITPGYRFRAADLLLTNFHLPRSTLFMLVAAFSGLATMREAYAQAIAAGYRFYSYGDACLLHPAQVCADG